VCVCRDLSGSLSLWHCKRERERERQRERERVCVCVCERERARAREREREREVFIDNQKVTEGSGVVTRQGHDQGPANASGLV